MLERILELLKQKGMSPSQFADEIGIQRSGMSHLISGRNKPSLEFIMKVLARFPETDPVWLIQGIESRVSSQPVKTNGTTQFQSDLFDPPELAEIPIPSFQEKKKKKTEAEKTIEKVVIFYSDRTFREYGPEVI